MCNVLSNEEVYQIYAERKGEMIKIEFTCLTCGETTNITVDDIDEKTIVPVCDACYKIFLSRKRKIVKSFQKKLECVYEKYGIPVDTFNANEELSEISDID